MNESGKQAGYLDKDITVCFISNIAEKIKDYLNQKLKSLDNIDLILLEILKRDPRAKISTLSKLSKLSRKTITRHLEKLINIGAFQVKEPRTISGIIFFKLTQRFNKLLDNIINLPQFYAVGLIDQNHLFITKTI